MIDKFIYVHILKTAGTTLRENFFAPVYKERCLTDRSFKDKIRKNGERKKHLADLENQLYPSDYENYDVIFGHFKGDKYIHLNQPMFSFVRHPVDRMISHYYFCNRRNIMMERGPSLIEFAEKNKNYMTYVLGDISKYEYIGVVEDFKKSLQTMCDIIEVECPETIIPKRVKKYREWEITSSDDRKEIEGINSKDMELYNEVLSKQ